MHILFFFCGTPPTINQSPVIRRSRSFLSDANRTVLQTFNCRLRRGMRLAVILSLREKLRGRVYPIQRCNCAVSRGRARSLRRFSPERQESLPLMQKELNRRKRYNNRARPSASSFVLSEDGDAGRQSVLTSSRPSVRSGCTAGFVQWTRAKGLEIFNFS